MGSRLNRVAASIFLIIMVMMCFASSLHSVIYLNVRNTTFGNVATTTDVTNYSPPGFTRVTGRGRLNYYFVIYKDIFDTNTSWSGGINVTNTDYGSPMLIPRRSQGNTNYARQRAPIPNANRFFTVVTVTNVTNAPEKFGVFWTTTTPRRLTICSNNITNIAYANSNVTVFLRVNNALSAEEYLLVRYTTNDWADSMYVKATVAVSPNYTAVIPAMPSGTLVKYYPIHTANWGSNYVNGTDCDYVTLSCISNQSNPYFYYTSGTYHQLDLDGANNFNTNHVERFMTTTAGYTNWITWDSNFLYMGFYGSDIGSADANKVLYVYFTTNTNTNNATGWAYANPEGPQSPVLPFKANYFFRKQMSGPWSSGVWSNAQWNTNVSPLTTGISNRIDGNLLALRIHRTNFQNTTAINLSNLFMLSFMVDNSAGSEKIYAAAPSNTLVDGYRANPSNYFAFRQNMWVSNQIPVSNRYVTNDIDTPWTNAILGPTNNQTNITGDVIILSNFARDMVGLYKIVFYTNNGLLTNVFVTNTNAVYYMNYDTALFRSGTYYFSSVAYDTKNILRSRTTNTNVFIAAGSLFLPGTWNFGQYNTPFTNVNMPTGFYRRSVTASLNDYFLIHNSGWDSNTAWSSGYQINMTNIVTNIPRNDQGAWPASTNWARLTVWPGVAQVLTVVSRENPTNTNETFGFMTTGAVPVYITASSNNIAGSYASANSNVTVFVNISGAKSAAERIVVRYTTNNFANSMVATASLLAGNLYSAVIPAMGSGLVVEYYPLVTAMADLYLTNGYHDYSTLACLGDEATPYAYYTAGTYHTIGIDGINDFNTNDLEMRLTTTDGYTNWITWDSNFLYIGYYGADFAANDANKLFYIYFSTNTNTTTNLNRITGTAYGEAQGTQLPVLPFHANYFFRYDTTGSWSTAVWTNDAWNSGVSPLNTGISAAGSGEYFEMRVHKTNFANAGTIGFTNLNMIMFMMDKTPGAEQIYAATPSNVFVDGYQSNPSNFLRFTQVLWVSNILPSSNGNLLISNDNIAPYTNWLLNPVNNKTNFAGDLIIVSNFARDETGIYKIEVYTNIGALYTNIFVSNTNAIYTLNIDSANMNPGTNRFYTIAYDTKNSRSSQTNIVLLRVLGKVYVPESRHQSAQFGNETTNIGTAPGFVSFVTQLRRNDYFIIHKDGWASNTAWSSGTAISSVDRTWTINRNDQGAWPAGTNWARLTGSSVSTIPTIFISSTNISGTSEKFGILQSSAYPIMIDDVSASPDALANEDFVVDIALSGTPSAEERIMVRYTTNNWASSMVVQAADTGSGVDYQALIPPMRSGSLVRFYALSTTAPNLYLTNGDHDYVTISCFSNQSSPFIYYVSGTLHTIAVDGTNDFNTNDSERLLTTTAGYTNWITWDSNFLYLGYYGEDIGAGDANKMLYYYFSTNTNRSTNQSLVTGSAYGEPQGNQFPVLSFRANYFVKFLTTGAWSTGYWSNQVQLWFTNSSPLTAGVSNVRVGNFLETRIARTNFMNLTAASFTNMNYSAFMLDRTGGAEKIYGAVPEASLTDGFNRAPSLYLSYADTMWVSNILPADSAYRVWDNFPPFTNALLWPANNALLDLGATIPLTNHARDEAGIYLVEIYTNTNALFNFFWVTNTNANYIYPMNTTTFNEGVYNFYTLAYDTTNVVSSSTNTNVRLRIRADLTIYKTVSSVNLPPMSDLLKPGALVTYQLTYTNSGPHHATNVVIYDRIPNNTTYHTNYAGTASGWTVQFAHVENPDQTYASLDYDTSPANVLWIRWKKPEVTTAESGGTLFLGVTVD